MPALLDAGGKDACIMVPAPEEQSVAGGRQTRTLKNHTVKCVYRSVTKELEEKRTVNLG